MIIDAVEYHEDSIPAGNDWTSAAVLLATFCVWAKEHDAFAPDAFGAEHDRTVSEIGDPRFQPSQWVADNIDYTLSDQFFSPPVAESFSRLVASGKYYRQIEDAFGGLYQLPDNWENLRPAVELLNRAITSD